MLELFYCTVVWRKKAETSQEDKAQEEKLLFQENLVLIMYSRSTEKNLSVYKHYIKDPSLLQSLALPPSVKQADNHF